ncbi:MAG: maltooligosyltrehalose trehalohydrolase [Acidobacteriota bacterium]|jgi:maltooligosyltrehalose trehalohydrolase|nr:maltooligosyltrehalose trehalohydrolase [Acidobacteriota bacterium]
MTSRRYPVGAEVQSDGVHFRVWAPEHERVDVIVDGAEHPLERERDGYFSGFIDDIGDGARYGFRLDRGERTFPDPASRFQPEGPHELSAVVDRSAYPWNDRDWRGVDRDAAVIYEMHVGTFTTEGTWRAAEQHLAELRDIGITLIELMPVADFPGRFGWGYDGVNLWAPTRLYGAPDDMRHFIDAAHAADLSVILDVVYNHLGPDGNYLKEFSPHYFTDRYPNDWGQSINFDGEQSQPVREFYASNAAYWIDEFHLDGLRLDATQSVIDLGSEHILSVVSRRAREAANGRRIYLVAENEEQEVRLVMPCEAGGYGIDALWNDDFHHSAHVTLTGQTGGYYQDYRGTPQELVSMAKHGFLYQGQWYSWQKQRRGTRSIGFPPRTFVWFLENHDQVANSAGGERIHQLADAATIRAMTALLLLGPATPMLFQGQELGSTAPFAYFADHRGELAEQVAQGRRKFLKQFPSLATPEMQARVPPPNDPEVFRRCQLDRSERNEQIVALHRDLLRIRRDDPPFSPHGAFDGAVLSADAFVLRSLDDDRLLLINLGRDLRLDVIDEPLLAVSAKHDWMVRWSSESGRYGGGGVPALFDKGAWRIPARSALLLAAEPQTEE